VVDVHSVRKSPTRRPNQWIQAIEFVESHTSFGEGEGGYNEDQEYYGELANI
jgi:hypothetical protein